MWNASIDGYVLPTAPEELFARGRQSDVRLMIGWTANEGAAMGLATFGDDRESFCDQMAARLGKAAEELFRLYPVGSADAARAGKVALAGDGFIGFPSRRWITAQQRTGKQPIFVYQFNHAPPRKNFTLTHPARGQRPMRRSNGSRRSNGYSGNHPRRCDFAGWTPRAGQMRRIDRWR